MLGQQVCAKPTAGRFAFKSGAARVNRRIACNATAVESPLLKNIQFINPKWSGVENEQQFLEVLQGEVAAGRCPKQLVPAWQDFYNNYKTAVVGSGVEGADEKLASRVQASIADTVLNQFIQPYQFPSFHERILEPYNYFEFGQRYVSALIDFNSSLLGNPAQWDTINQQLEQGHNVVLLANHQTEADPGVFAHMLAASNPKLSTDVVYVAGDRVVTDPLCKPFSMGRNLFCIYSKRHMGDIPELKAQKMEANRKTLVAMQKALNKGGVLMWIAPSGGRDRPKEDGQYLPDVFDAAAVELMRNLVNRAKQPGHLYPMAMYSWPMMPPPKTVDKALGERRITHFTPVGINVGEQLDVSKIISSVNAEDKEAQQLALAKHTHQEVTKLYVELETAIKDASKRGSAFTQPWKA